MTDLRTRCEREIDQGDNHDRFRDHENAGEPWEVTMARDRLDKDAKLARILEACNYDLRFPADDDVDMGRRCVAMHIKSIIESEVKP